MLSATANCGQYSTFVSEKRKNTPNVDLGGQGGGGGGGEHIYIYIYIYMVPRPSYPHS